MSILDTYRRLAAMGDRELLAEMKAAYVLYFETRTQHDANHVQAVQSFCKASGREWIVDAGLASYRAERDGLAAQNQRALESLRGTTNV